MTRSNISVGALKAKGYREYEFGDYTLEKAVEYIKSGCETRLEPRAHGEMVAVVMVNGYGHDMFWRDMTPEEKERYAAKIAELKEKEGALIRKIDRKNRAKIRKHY